MLRSVLVLVLLSGLSAPLQAQPLPTPSDRDAALVATTLGFRFYSDFWLNIHDYLFGLAGGGPGDVALEAEGTGCIAALPAEQAEAWAAAVAHYEAYMAERHHRRDPLVRAVRYRLSGLDASQGTGSDEGRLMTLLRAAAPAYRACLWGTHDARNRARIADLTTLLSRHEAALTETLSTQYQSAWPDGVTVDVGVPIVVRTGPRAG